MADDEDELEWFLIIPPALHTNLDGIAPAGSAMLLSF